MAKYESCPRCGVEGSVRPVGPGRYHCTDCGACWRDPKIKKTAKLPAVRPKAGRQKGVA